MLRVDEERRAVIELLASFVADDGFELEAAVREREAGNPLFAFLRENTAEATYYRWRVYALAMGGGPRSTRPAKLQTDGVWWVPPAVPRARSKRTGVTSVPNADRTLASGG